LAGYLLPDFDTAEIRRRFAQEVGTSHESEWWRGFTAMFLHGSAMHLAFNMWALWLFGPALERRFGTLPFGALYLAAGLNGAALFAGINSGPAAAVGASGAIFGLFGALLLNAFRQRHTRAGHAIFNQLIMLLGINLMLPFVVAGIAWEAHVGGLIAGLVIAFVWDRLPNRGPHLLMQRTIIALMVASAALAILILL
ncbi:MAG: rhomboid family intramembrane serine protease, partial [Acidimicrobiia bacterium]|nr:rhomboid family intramembrane serine protease [Acidimicrobiia bacterium]